MELHMDLIANILVKLPLKGIVISKCVCKSWYELISNPNFTSHYAKNSPFTTIFLTQDYYKHDSDRKSLFLLEFSAGGEFIQTPIKPKMPRAVDVNSDFRVSVIGSCDCSVFLLHRDIGIDTVYSFNPVSGLCVEVTEGRFLGSQRHVVYSVGYVPANDVCKLIRFADEKAEIFAVGVDKRWRIVDDLLRFSDSWSKQVICFNGAYHWVAKPRKHDEIVDKICTFDLFEEKTGAGITKPPGLSCLSWLTMSLMVFHDRLSVADHSSDSEMVIWTMREYGVAESWCKEIVLGLCRVPYHYPVKLSCGSLFPIAALHSGKNILFLKKYSGELFVYSVEKRRLGRVKVIDVDYPNSPSRTLYANAYAPRFYLLIEGEGGIESGGR